jgi:hypothetical protein
MLGCWWGLGGHRIAGMTEWKMREAGEKQVTSRADLSLWAVIPAGLSPTATAFLSLPLPREHSACFCFSKRRDFSTKPQSLRPCGTGTWDLSCCPLSDLKNQLLQDMPWAYLVFQRKFLRAQTMASIKASYQTHIVDAFWSFLHA